ncbi:MAG: hypothetical protein NZZ41_04370 [Candidatus Dojkabacteria bacterium]|nr:hypothetical protein [Candidatus Dojkabacteria bacterium]
MFYFVYIYYEEQIVDYYVEIEDNTQFVSIQEAEFLNLLTFYETAKTVLNKKNNVSTIVVNLDGIVVDNFYRSPSKSLLFINNDRSIDTKYFLNTYDTLFIEQKTFTQVFQLDELKQIVHAITKLDISGIQKIIFSSTLLYALDYENYYDFVKSIFKDKKLIQIVDLKWGDSINYSDYRKYKYAKSIVLKDYSILNFFDEIWIENFDYTTPNSILSGPISSIDKLKAALSYYHSKGIFLDKLVVWINTLGYLWPYREFEISLVNNYISQKQESRVLTTNEIDLLKKYVKQKIQHEYFDDIMELQIDNQDYYNYLVLPSRNYVEEQINTAKKFHVKKIVIF